MSATTVVQENVQKTGQKTEKAKPPRRLKRRALFTKETMLPAIRQAFMMLRPDTQWKNPVMFVVEVGAFLTLLYIL